MDQLQLWNLWILANRRSAIDLPLYVLLMLMAVGVLDPREVVTLMTAREELRCFIDHVLGRNLGRDTVTGAAHRTARAIREAAADTGWVERPWA